MNASRRLVGRRMVDLLTGAVEGHGTLRPRELALLRYLLENRDRVVSGDELLEKVWGYRSGVRSKTVYSTIYRLREQLEEDPAHPTVVLAERGEGYRLALEPLPPLPAPEIPAPGIPVALDELVGREPLLARAVQALQRSRLVTLVGGPGFGKTRLAQELARRSPVAARWMAVAPEASLWSGLACLLGLSSAGAELPEAVARALRAPGPGWLILDDADRLSTSERGALIELLQRAPELRALATAREPLSLPGEQLVEVGPLSDEESERLLCARAPGVSEAPPALLSRLSQRLQGIPLALELAAALIPTLGASGLVEALERDIETLDIAASALRPGLSAALARSWEALPPEEQRALIGLAVFQGSFPLRAARAVLGEPATSWITKLTRRSLLHLAPADGPARYRMLAPIRETLLAWTPAPQRAEVELVHARWFYEMAQEVTRSPDRSPLTQELAELRRAAATLSERGLSEQALQITLWLAALLPPEACSPALLDDLSRYERPAPPVRLRSSLEGCRARLLRLWGRLDESCQAARRAVRLADSSRGRAIASVQLMLAGDVVGDIEAVREATEAFESVKSELSPYLVAKGTVESARAWLNFDPERSCALLEQVDPRSPHFLEPERIYVDTLRAAARLGSDPAAERSLLEIIERYRAAGSTYNADQTCCVLVRHMLRQGRADEAERMLQQRDHPERTPGLKHMLAAWIAWLRGDARSCRAEALAGLEASVRLGDSPKEAHACAALAQLDRQEGRWSEALQWLQRASRRQPHAGHDRWALVIQLEREPDKPVQEPAGADLPSRCVVALLAAPGAPLPPLEPPLLHELADRIGADLTRRRSADR